MIAIILRAIFCIGGWLGAVAQILAAIVDYLAGNWPRSCTRIMAAFGYLIATAWLGGVIKIQWDREK